MESRQRAVSAKRGRVTFTNRGRVFAKNKRLSKRRGMTVREGDAIQHDAMARGNIRSGWHKNRDDGKRNETPMEEEGRQSGKRRAAKGRQEGRGRKRGRKGERGTTAYKESVCKRANYELVRRRPLRVATNKRPVLFVVLFPRRPRRRSF